MKALQLVNSLTKKESDTFTAVIKNKGRKSLSQLQKYLQKYDGDKPEKSDMYEAAFKTKYSPDKDYLLRNELRLLSDELTNFILQQEIEEEMRSNPNIRNARYLKALRRRKLDEIFLAEYDKLKTKAEDEMQIELAEEMAKEKMLILYQIFDSRNIAREVYEACESYVDSVIKQAQFNVRLSEFYRDIAWRRWTNYPTHKDIAPPAALPPRRSLDIGATKEDPALTRYYTLFAKALHCDSEERVQVLSDALEAIEKCAYPEILQWRLKAGCLNFLGITYNELGETDRHFDMFRQSLQLQEANGNRAITQLMNYLQGLLYYKRTDTFWLELERFSPWFDDGPNLENLNEIIQFAHEASGSYDEALIYLNKLNVSTDYQYLLVKSTLVSIYYNTGEYALVQNECTNALQFLRNRDSEVFVYRCHELEYRLATLLAGYQMALPEEKDVILKRIRKQLETQNTDFIQKMTTTFMRSRWVIEKALEVTSDE